MAVRKARIEKSIGPVRALALKHTPALMLLQRHVDVDWREIEYAAEQVVAGFYYPEGVDQREKEKDENENPEFDRDAVYRPTGTESRRQCEPREPGRRSAKEDEGEVEGWPVGSD